MKPLVNRAFSREHRVWHLERECSVLKVQRVKMALFSSNSREDLLVEIKIQASLDHPNIVRIIESFDNKTGIFVVMELCSGGDLEKKLRTQPNGRYEVAAAAELVHTMM